MIIDYKSYYKERISLCLGFFDSLHVGHRKLIEICKEECKKSGAIPTVFTFSNNPLELLSKSGGLIYTFSERLIKLSRCDIDSVIYCHCDVNMMRMSAENFEEYLVEHFNITHIVVGTDYTYGYECRGTAATLKAAMKVHNITVEIIDLIVYNNIKIGSTYIRRLLESGDVVLANKLLSEPYSVFGEVTRGRGAGRRIGFPTANLALNFHKVRIKDGVYATVTIIDGVKYSSVTNVGNHPTFDDNTYNIETHILDFDADIYGKQIEVMFFTFMRSITRFTSIDGIIAQLQKDSSNRRDIITE